MKYIKINGQEYKAKEFDFNMICDLEDYGVSIDEAGEKPMKMVRAYVAMCMGKSLGEAGKDIEQHVLNGGDFTEPISIMYEEMEKSNFFQALFKKAEKNNPENQKAEK